MVTSVSADAPIDGSERLLTEGWQFLMTSPGLIAGPEGLPETGWIQAAVPGTVALSLRAVGRFPLDSPQDFDALDTWVRCRFERPACAEGARLRLCFDGLATL